MTTAGSGDPSPGTGRVPCPRRLVDGHHHVWDLHRGVYPWLADDVPLTRAWIGDYADIRRTYTMGEYLDEAAPCGLVKSVHVEAGWGGDPVGETTWLDDVAKRSGFPHAIVAAADLRSASVASTLDRHAAASDLLRGIRMTEMGELVADAAFRRGVAELATRDLTYDLNTRWQFADLALDLARTFPGTSIIVNNTGNPGSLDEEELSSWRAAMAGLAQAQNVAIKISGLGMAGHAPTVGRIRPWVLAAIELFGVDRCMFASNWPVDRLYGSYADLIDAYGVIVTGFSRSEQDAMFAGNAECYYRI